MGPAEVQMSPTMRKDQQKNVPAQSVIIASLLAMTEKKNWTAVNSKKEIHATFCRFLTDPARGKVRDKRREQVLTS